jgi:hypothetical protein
MLRCALLTLALALAAGCGRGARPPAPERAAKRDGHTPFRGLPVKARLVPAVGGVHTVFRIRFRAREPVGRRGDARLGYSARLMNLPGGSGCIVDTGGFFEPRRRAIVLDPRAQKGGLWCRGRFSGRITYYRDYACPARGTCHVPRGFPRRHRTVARVSFRVR